MISSDFDDGPRVVACEAHDSAKDASRVLCAPGDLIIDFEPLEEQSCVEEKASFHCLVGLREQCIQLLLSEELHTKSCERVQDREERVRVLVTLSVLKDLLELLLNVSVQERNEQQRQP